MFPCAQQLSASSTAIPVSATAPGLSPETTYSVTLVASTTQGTSSGATMTFTTAGPSAKLQVSNLKISPSKFRRGKRAPK